MSRLIVTNTNNFYKTFGHMLVSCILTRANCVATVVYGITTGFGKFARTSISPEKLGCTCCLMKLMKADCGVDYRISFVSQ